MFITDVQLRSNRGHQGNSDSFFLLLVVDQPSFVSSILFSTRMLSSYFIIIDRPEYSWIYVEEVSPLYGISRNYPQGTPFCLLREVVMANMPMGKALIVVTLTWNTLITLDMCYGLISQIG